MKPYADLIQMTTGTQGTGPLALDVYAGWSSFDEHFAVGERAYYLIESGAGATEKKEVGLGTLTAAGVLARTTILGTVEYGRVPAWVAGGTPIDLQFTSIVRCVAPSALLDSFGTITYELVSTSGPVLAAHSYGVVANNLVLDLPANPAPNDRIEFLQAFYNIIGTVINPVGQSINGIPGPMTVDIANFAFGLVFNTGYGWKVTQ